MLQRWLHLCARLSTAGEAVGVESTHNIFSELQACYTSPDRHYHNLQHIAACLTQLDSARAFAIRVDLVEAAIWFHDAVYDPRRRDNEAQSAGLAERALRRIDVPRRLREAVADLILITRHHQDAPASPDHALLLDIDLAILGQPDDVFDQYERDIRAEYSFMPESDFRAGRAAILRALAARDRIYLTEAFYFRYEAKARENLNRSLVALHAAP